MAYGAVVLSPVGVTNCVSGDTITTASDLANGDHVGDLTDLFDTAD